MKTELEPTPPAAFAGGQARWGRSTEVRLRRRVEQAVERLGRLAVRMGVDSLARPWARPLEAASEPRPAPFIVVLSGGIRSTGELNATSVARVRRAAELFTAGLAPRLIVSGGPRRPGRPSSAPRMLALAAALGVPPGRILVEERSSRTGENALEVAGLLRRHGAESALLVTSALHTRRAGLCFARQGIEAITVAVANAAEEPVERRSVVAQALHEAIGLAYYRLRGWL